MTARFAGGLGRTSVTLPKGWTISDRLANAQVAAQSPDGSESVDLILAPGASSLTTADLARAAAREYKSPSGALGTIHPPLTVNGLTFSYVTGVEPGSDITEFDVIAPAAAGGYDAISVGFEFEPSVPHQQREALYRPVLASLTYH